MRQLYKATVIGALGVCLGGGLMLFTHQPNKTAVISPLAHITPMVFLATPSATLTLTNVTPTSAYSYSYSSKTATQSGTYGKER